MSQQKSYDYIIIGAGSAGCVLANHLSADANTSVLLLEAGPSDKRFFIQMPIGYGKTFYQPKVNWMYTSKASAGLSGRASYWPRGKVLGGSSSINAMVYVRGHKKDFDDWESAGNPGWSYEDVLPYFKRMESWQHGADEFRGGSGPLKIADVSAKLHPLCKHFVAAGEAIGIDYNADMNGAKQEGVGYYQLTTYQGQRMSAARAYLKPARNRPNLTLVCNALVERIVFDGKRAVAVDYQHKHKQHRVNATKEIILSAGAVNSPQLLQLSGVGPKEVLQQAGVVQVHESPAVGQHLQDHLGHSYFYRANQPTLNQQLRPWWGKLWQGMRYVLTRSGPLSLSVNQAGGFVHTRKGLDRPNIQLYFAPLSYTKAPVGERPMMNPDPFPAYLLGISNCRVKSEGAINIASNDPRVAPKIEPNYLTHKDEVQDLLEGVKLIRKLAQTAQLQAITLDEMSPGIDCKTDAQLIEDIRNNADTVFHPCGTCRMGPDPHNNVVDNELKVHGLEGLRVVDASIFPNVVCGNINAATIMVGEKAADLILAAHR
jgi:choline dehydrogenase